MRAVLAILLMVFGFAVAQTTSGEYWGEVRPNCIVDIHLWDYYEDLIPVDTDGDGFHDMLTSNDGQIDWFTILTNTDYCTVVEVFETYLGPEVNATTSCTWFVNDPTDVLDDDNEGEFGINATITDVQDPQGYLAADYGPHGILCEYYLGFGQ